MDMYTDTDILEYCIDSFSKLCEKMERDNAALLNSLRASDDHLAGDRQDANRLVIEGACNKLDGCIDNIKSVNKSLKILLEYAEEYRGLAYDGQ